MKEDFGDYDEVLMEELSDQIHEQWRYWISYLIDEFGDDLPEELVERWREDDVPYSDLSDDEKDKDRKWAKKYIDIMDEYFQDVGEEERWMIVENLIESERGLRDMGCEDTANKMEDLLDDLSPNWKSADSCKDVELKRVKVRTGSGS